MNKTIQNTKVQGSITSGVFLIVMSLVIVGLIAPLTLLARELESLKIFTYVVYGSLGLFLFIYAFFPLVRGIMGAIIRRNGHLSTCQVVDIKYGMKGQKTLYISYKGESGYSHIIKVYKNGFCANRIHIGDVLDCSILGEDCWAYMRVASIK